MKVKKIGTIYILCEILPVLSDLSRVFQQDTINFAHIKPSITVCEEKLATLVESKSPIKKLQDDLAEGRTLAVTEIKFSSKDIKYLENLLKNYVNELVRNVTKRFKDVTPVLTAMQLFDKTAIPLKEVMISWIMAKSISMFWLRTISQEMTLVKHSFKLSGNSSSTTFSHGSYLKLSEMVNFLAQNGSCSSSLSRGFLNRDTSL